MTSHEKRFEQKLWNIVNDLRGRVDADEFRNYILGFIFYKYLSERLSLYADRILKADNPVFADLDQSGSRDREILAAVEEKAIEALGYYLNPSELFSAITARGKEPGSVILADLARILDKIGKSIMGSDSGNDFDNLLNDMDLTSTRLGRTEMARNTLIAKIMGHLDTIDFRLDDIGSDVLGDAYEYLIDKFASGAGRKAGEFYTPQQVSTILARIVATGKTRLRSVYDPTCGSGSLLLRVAREVGNVETFHSQELNRTTCNLARMNMILHGVHQQNFDIQQEDTLEHPRHMGMLFEAIVANPPFSANWSANRIFENDDRFSEYGKLAPRSKADLAFVQHMLHHLDEDGTMAVVLPHGALFRGGAEGVIRRFMVENRNWLDAVIGLPANIFYGTGIPTCILVFRKRRENNDVLFVDASACFRKSGSRNILRNRDVKRIVNVWRKRVKEDRFSHRASLDEIRNNGFNLSISRYVDTYQPEPEVDLNAVARASRNLAPFAAEIEGKLNKYCAELGLDCPGTSNLPLIRDFKRGIMQRLFNRTLRFTRNDGTTFPDWELHELREIAEFNPKSGRPLPEKFTYIDLDCVTDGVLSIPTEMHLANAPSRAQRILLPGDVLFQLVRPYQKNNLLFDLKGDFVASTGYAQLRPRQDGRFLFQLLHTDELAREVLRRCTGTGYPAITSSELARISVWVPCVDEQRRIADFLSAVDASIDIIFIRPISV